MADTTPEPTLTLSRALPFELEILKSPRLKYAETVVLVPFYGGKKAQLRRHADFLLESGYNVAWFRLEDFKVDANWLQETLISSGQKVGIKHIWADQIESALNNVPGRKFIYAFSNPSASAIEAIVRRHATDIAGLICDSGPSGNLLASMNNYFRYEDPIRWTLIRWAAAALLTMGWSPQFRSEISKDLDQIPAGFPILSIRGWKDRIISTHDIDLVFEPHSQLDWRKLSLPKADHLNGLRDFREEYVPPVLRFLESLSTPHSIS